MLSMEDFAAIKIAIQLCNGPELKREIIFVPSTEGLRNTDCTDRCKRKPHNYKCKWDVKSQWDGNMEKKISFILGNLGLTKNLQKKISGYVLLIGTRMVTWAKYHENVLNVSRDFCISFLNASLFTSKGLIDNSKAAEELIKSSVLNVEQRYRVACLYCFIDEIHYLYKVMSETANKPPFVKNPQHLLIEFWTLYVPGEIESTLGGQNLYEYLMSLAIECGSQETIEFCLSISKINRGKTRELMNIIERVADKIRPPRLSPSSYDVDFDDWLVFQQCSYYNTYASVWIPDDYYFDAVFFLLNKATEVQRIKFLKNNLEWIKYREFDLERSTHLGVLKNFLNWPYQDHFMKIVNLIWEILPEWVFVDLLQVICSKIETEKGTLRHGESGTYDYKKLLKDFWNGSPQSFKKFVFSKKEDTSTNDEWEFVLTIFLLKNFTAEDRKNVELILESATEGEKETVALSKCAEKVSLQLIERKEWRKFDLFVSCFHSSKKQIDNYKKKFIFTKKVQWYCIKFAIREGWGSAESFMRGCALSDVEIIQLKKEILTAVDGNKILFKKLFLHLPSPKIKKTVNEFCDGLFATNDELQEFKKSFISDDLSELCSEVVRKNKLERLDTIISWWLCYDQEKVDQFKRTFVIEHGGELCKYLISNYGQEVHDLPESYLMPNLYEIIQFGGGKWDQVEEFLTFCLSSVEEINNFKRQIFYEVEGNKTLFNLIAADQWKEAEVFFSWLRLTPREVEKLKKDAIVANVSEIYNIIFGCNWKWNRIERLLRWGLSDIWAVIEFRDRFSNEFVRRSFGINENFWDEAAWDGNFGDGNFGIEEVIDWDENAFWEEEMFGGEEILPAEDILIEGTKPKIGEVSEHVSLHKLYTLLENFFIELD